MKVNVYNAETFALVNVRHVDEVVEHEFDHGGDEEVFGKECARAIAELKSAGRYWIGKVYITPRR